MLICCPAPSCRGFVNVLTRIMLSSSESRTIYTSRINRVITFITNNLSEPLYLDLLAKKAYFSPYHFHRIFTYMLGETPNAFVNRLRVEKAANMLQKNSSLSITDIAFDCGFSSSAAFARSFRQYFGISASKWRKEHQHDSNILFPSLSHYPGTSGENQYSERLLWNIQVKFMPGFHVAYVANLEGYDIKKIRAIWDTLCKWAVARDLLTPDTTAIGISFDDPEITPTEKCRYYACISVPDDIIADDVVGIMDITPGKYAVYSFEGQQQDIQPTYKALYKEWLPDSGYQPADVPCYEICHSAPENYYEGLYKLDICLPVVPL